ncbi:MAG TPA: hypothetical protein VFH54_00085 [Mycobacteriales bacterium]|nr:hypothetical protein [Mycobacteriales bacterium]
MGAPKIPEQLLGRPFTLAQARAAGLTGRALQGGQWRRVLRGVWAHVDVSDSRELRLAAVLLVLPPDAVARELTAAWLYGADVRRADDLDVHIYVPAGRRMRSRDGLVVSVAQLSDADIFVYRGLRVTSGVRTVFDCLRLADETEALVAADALLHLQCTRLDDVTDYISRTHRVRNSQLALTRLRLAEPKTESPMETRLRLLLLRAGLPPPQAQWVVRENGRFVARLDFAWPSVCVAIEYDGAEHWGQRRHDDRRRAAARALGWHIDVVSAEDYYRTPDEIVDMVRRALAGRGLR